MSGPGPDRFGGHGRPKGLRPTLDVCTEPAHHGSDQLFDVAQTCMAGVSSDRGYGVVDKVLVEMPRSAWFTSWLQGKRDRMTAQPPLCGSCRGFRSGYDPPLMDRSATRAFPLSHETLLAVVVTTRSAYLVAAFDTLVHPGISSASFAGHSRPPCALCATSILTSYSILRQLERQMPNQPEI